MGIVKFHLFSAFAKKQTLYWSFWCNEGFRHFHVRHCNASLLRHHPWEESQWSIWSPSPQTGNPNPEPVWKSFLQKNTCPITTCAKCALNDTPRSWSLESNQNSVCRSLCVLLEDLHDVYPWQRAIAGSANTLLLNSRPDLKTHMHKVGGISSVLTQLKGIQPTSSSRWSWNWE